MRIVVGILALAAAVNVVLAQPFPTGDLDPQMRMGSGSGSATPSVRMPIDPDFGDGSGSGSGSDEAYVPQREPVVGTSIEAPIDPDHYTCGPGDLLELNFWGQQNLTLKLKVDLEGRVFVPKVGYVAVADKTLTVVRGAVKQKVRANYPGLSFDLSVVTPRTFLVHVVENVKRPGVIAARAVDRVSTVLARVGVLPQASRRRIIVTHRDGKQVTADLVKYELTGEIALDPYLLDGDVVRVPYPQTQVKVQGAVRRQGTYELIASKDVAELLELAGGLAPNAAKLPIRIVRRDASQHEVYLDAQATTPLVDDDKLVVRSADDLQRTVLLIGAVAGSDPLDSATTSRRLPFVEGDTVWSLIDRAGGIKAPGDLRRSYISRPNAKGQDLIAVDLDALLVRRDLKADRPVEIGDTIVIPPMQYSVMVEGAVGRAGLYNYNPLFGVPEYIAHAGGLSRTAKDLDEVKLIESSGGTRDYHPGMKLNPGDAILVPERNFSRGEIAQLVLATAGLVLSGVAIVLAAR